MLQKMNFFCLDNLEELKVKFLHKIDNQTIIDSKISKYFNKEKLIYVRLIQEFKK